MGNPFNPVNESGKAMILAWHSRLAVESWRISRRPGDLPIYVARRVVTDFASAIARLEQQDAKNRRRRK
jgi:hypothetical protein